MKYLKTFALCEGRRYQYLVPDANLVSPTEAHLTKGFLAYFEKDYPKQGMIRGAHPHGSYQAEWFDPRTGEWSKAGNGILKANVWGWITLPNFPSNDDWGLKLTLAK